MLIKFFDHGKVCGAVEYLMDTERHPNGVQVLDGDPELTRLIYEELPFSTKYSSGAISFTERESATMTDAKLRAIVADFKRGMFAGLRDDQYNDLIVKHSEHGRIDAHFVVPHVLLDTGRQWAPYFHKADLPRFELLRDFLNEKYDGDDPLAANRRRMTREPDLSLKRTGRIGAEATTRKELVKAINAVVEKGIASGELRSRDDVVELLRNGGFEITRQGVEYVSVKADDMQKAVKLKGGAYNASFGSVAELREEYGRREGGEAEDLRRGVPEDGGGVREDGGRRLDDLAQRLRDACERRAQVLGRRFKGAVGVVASGAAFSADVYAESSPEGSFGAEAERKAEPKPEARQEAVGVGLEASVADERRAEERPDRDGLDGVGGPVHVGRVEAPVEALPVREWTGDPELREWRRRQDREMPHLSDEQRDFQFAVWAVDPRQGNFGQQEIFDYLLWTFEGGDGETEDYCEATVKAAVKEVNRRVDERERQQFQRTGPGR